MTKRKYDPAFINSAIEELHDYCIDVEHREIFLHSHVSTSEEETGTDHRMFATFIKNIQYLDSKNSEQILIHQNNFGGDITHGMAIYDAIASCRSHVTILCHGDAASMGNLILQAADLRLSMPSCSFLIHPMSLSLESASLAKFKSWAGYGDVVDKQMTEIYVGRCHETGAVFKGKSKAQVKQYIKRKLDSKIDWFLTATEALEHGFIDGIIGQTHKMEEICMWN